MNIITMHLVYFLLFWTLNAYLPYYAICVIVEMHKTMRYKFNLVLSQTKTLQNIYL